MENNNHTSEPVGPPPSDRTAPQRPSLPDGEAPGEQGGFLQRNLGKMLVAGGAAAALAALAVRSNAGSADEPGDSPDLGQAAAPDLVAGTAGIPQPDRQDARRLLRRAMSNADALLDASGIPTEGACTTTRDWHALMRRMIRRQIAAMERPALCRSPQEAMVVQTHMIAEQTDMALRGWLAMVPSQVEATSRVVRGVADQASRGPGERDAMT
ncbi:hypothetical protein [Azospirillum sp. ST 5-10]|uniref:hypothetical protein n=1 Tax=unclassified Azospirillum TaxID=2630922 RepID=UPI003F4A0668